MSATLPILNAFKDRLKTRFAEWDVQLMPENIESYFLAHPNGGILISYAGSTFGEPRSTAEITQTRKVHIVLTVLSRDLHNDHGALQLLDDLRLDVTGFVPPSCTKCWLVEEQFDEQQSGVWIYQLVIATQTMQIQQTQGVSTKPQLRNIIVQRTD
ncbi:hypothetical protein A4212_09915 [Pasteurella multocida]|uniref:Gp37 family protein n=1 Tax=Pasteurella multocida TaxID=747 RepID=UPI00094B5A00|nr:Gp37 family protein [Pasteurella multocida]AUK45492.1 hypothetical protein A4212_09915 [Pasteurella multocida]NNI75884.1 hypothetical protein [Pasteurella multocida]HDR1102585.1 hypothetical protein [Pasteurella multocida]HDR1154211.1 hypothetical protein [Pasteurella multocida]HDR1165364.1 hypothetical protein [Pasteurella multocida]